MTMTLRIPEEAYKKMLHPRYQGKQYCCSDINSSYWQILILTYIRASRGSQFTLQRKALQDEHERTRHGGQLVCSPKYPLKLHLIQIDGNWIVATCIVKCISEVFGDKILLSVQAHCTISFTHNLLAVANAGIKYKISLGKVPIGGRCRLHQSTSRLSGGGRGLEAARALSSAGLGVSLSGTLNGSAGVLVLLARAVDSDLDSNLAALDLLAVHIGTGLLLHLLGGKSNKTEATALAGLVASLELADHELGDRTKSDLGRGRLVLSEDLKKLKKYVSKTLGNSSMLCSAYLLLAKVVRKVGNHDLGLAGNAVLRGTALLAGAVGVGLASLVDIDALLTGGGSDSLVGGLGERKDLAGNVGGGSAIGGSVSLAVDGALSSLTLLAATAASSTATTATTATAGRLAATGSALTTLSGGLRSGLGLASELDGNLAVKDRLAIQLLDGAVGLGGGGDVNEGVADRAGGARVGGDRGGLTEAIVSCWFIEYH
jgi:hypothetical protein